MRSSENAESIKTFGGASDPTEELGALPCPQLVEIFVLPPNSTFSSSDFRDDPSGLATEGP